mmetsp:Transcript_34476/g.32847  ORF Transcript_34476/g.32847 Transcript_34476/m.32847 type:complete len:592 (-) Transcript_34476:37-1812(-)
MGIVGLMKLITEEAPSALKEKEMENLNDRKVAIDASMAIYQFLVAVRTGPSGGGGASMQLTNEAGDVTSHIQGMFNRTIKMMESGVKPVYVFDGKPPQMKGGELAKRIAKRAKAETDLTAATEAGDVDEIDKFSRRLVKATRQHSEECKQLLTYMGVPYVNAPCEAEAQCAELAEKGKVYATATEDMDALTFRTPKLLRKFTSSQGKDKQPIIEVDFSLMLEGFGLTYEEFVDLCILCGCDYCGAIKGIGPKTALKLIRQHKTIEQIIAVFKKDKKYEIPPDWQTIKVSKKAIIQAEKESEDARLAAVARADALSASDRSASASAGSSSSATSGEVPLDTNGDEMTPADLNEIKVSVADDVVAGVEAGVETAITVLLEEQIELKETEEQGKEVAESKVEGEETWRSVAGSVLSPIKPAVTEASPAKITTEGPLPSKSPLKSPLKTNTEKADGEVMTVVTIGDEDPDEEYELIEPLYIQARLLFHRADVTPADQIDLKWEEPNEVELRKFLCEKMGFAPERVTTGIIKLQTAHRKKSQKRMDSFFTSSGVSASSTSIKRKADDAANKGAAKKGGKAVGGAKKGKPGPRSKGK